MFCIIITKKFRRRSWYEWWYDITPPEWCLEDGFFFDPRDWNPEDEIQVYEAQEELKKEFTHILENKRTGQKTFAKYLPALRPIPKLNYASVFFEYPIGEEGRISRNNFFIENIIILTDNTIWQLIDSDKAAQTPLSNWWYGERGIDACKPDSPFVFLLKSWEKDDALQIYCYEQAVPSIDTLYGHLKTNDVIYLIENKTRNQLIYGRPISASEFSDACLLYSKKELQRGFSSGFGTGYNSGYVNGRR